MKITLSPIARLSIDSLIAAQKVSYADLHVLADIKRKVSFSDEVRDSILRELGNGTAIVDKKALAVIQDEDIELEKAEGKKLQQILKDWPGFTAVDLDWLDPVMKQLDGPRT